MPTSPTNSASSPRTFRIHAQSMYSSLILRRWASRLFRHPALLRGAGAPLPADEFRIYPFRRKDAAPIGHQYTDGCARSPLAVRLRQTACAGFGTCLSERRPFLWDVLLHTSRDLPGYAETHPRLNFGHPYLVLLPALAMPLYRTRGALLPHHFNLAGPYGLRRYDFCGAVPELPAGRYPAPCFRGARIFLQKPPPNRSANREIFARTPIW